MTEERKEDLVEDKHPVFWRGWVTASPSPSVVNETIYEVPTASPAPKKFLISDYIEANASKYFSCTSTQSCPRSPSCTPPDIVRSPDPPATSTPMPSVGTPPQSPRAPQTAGTPISRPSKSLSESRRRPINRVLFVVTENEEKEEDCENTRKKKTARLQD